MRKINFLLTFALTGICISNASAGAWQHVAGAPGLKLTLNAYAGVPFTSKADPDPNLGPSIYSANSNFKFRFYPAAATPNETAPTSGHATHSYSLSGGPLISTASPLARARTEAYLGPYSIPFVDDTADPANANGTPPTTVQPETLNFSQNDQYQETITDPAHPNGLVVTMMDVTAYGSATTMGRPGGTATSNTNGIGIQTDDITVP